MDNDSQPASPRMAVGLQSGMRRLEQVLEEERVKERLAELSNEIALAEGNGAGDEQRVGPPDAA